MTVQEMNFAAFVLLRNVVYLIIALGIMFMMFEMLFRFMNAQLGISFKEHAWDEIQKSPLAVAVYFGLRVFGVLVACGLVASSFIK